MYNQPFLAANIYFTSRTESLEQDKQGVLPFYYRDTIFFHRITSKTCITGQQILTAWTPYLHYGLPVLVHEAESWTLTDASCRRLSKCGCTAGLVRSNHEFLHYSTERKKTTKQRNSNITATSWEILIDIVKRKTSVLYTNPTSTCLPVLFEWKRYSVNNEN